MDNISSLGLDIIETKYSGDWNVKGGRLYKGENLINNDSLILDAIKEKTGAIATVFLGDEKIATSELDSDGIRPIGARRQVKWLKVFCKKVLYIQEQRIFLAKHMP